MKRITIKLNWWKAIKDIKKTDEMEKLWIEIKINNSSAFLKTL